MTVIVSLDRECPAIRCDNDLQAVDGVVICVGCGEDPGRCDCGWCECCDDDNNHVHDDDTCCHPCCPDWP